MSNLGWDVIEVDVTEWNGAAPVQVVPTVEWPTGVPHILDDDCWCRPYRDGERPQLLIHREEARA